MTPPIGERSRPARGGSSSSNGTAARSATANGTEATATVAREDPFGPADDCPFILDPLPTTLRVAVERGFSLVPQKAAKRKVPLVEELRPLFDRPAGLRQVETWHMKHPKAIWAFVTGREFIVLDFDGPEGVALMEGLELKPRIITPTGGAHVWVKAPGYAVRGVTSPPEFPQTLP